MTRAVPARRKTYAVRWRDERAEVRAGKLELGAAALRLEGGQKRNRLSVRKIRYADVEGVRMAHGAAERIDGRPTAILRVRGRRAPLAIASVEGLGVVRELCDRLSLVASGMLGA